MSVVALGLNHTTAPLDLRSRFALPSNEFGPTLKRLRSRFSRSAEVAIVSTCNRTEIYVGSDGRHEDDLALQALDWLSESGGMDTPSLRKHLYVHEDADAARHAFRLASGLSSMVVGETQILGQLKHAVREADMAGTLGTTLHQLFQRSFAVAKEVRTETEVGMHTISLAAAVVRRANDLFEDFSALNVLFLGAGEMAGPVLAHIAARSPRTLTVANRSVAKGEAIASAFGASAMGLAAAMGRLAEFDVVVSCTASQLPIVGLGAVESAIKARRRKPMLMVDLAVPRDIEPQVAALRDVYLYTIDDLATIVQAGSGKRQAAIGQAELIIETGVREFLRWQGTRSTVPLIQALQAQAETWRMAELQRARKLMSKGEDLDVVLEALSKGIMQKMLHGPMAGLQSSGSNSEALSKTLSELFLQCPMRRQP